MSFTTTTKSDKKTALKLINKYADSYNIIIQENKALKTEIKDLRTNIKINKEIIEGFFSQSKQKEKNALFITKYKEEADKLYYQNEQLNKEIEALHNQINYKDQTFSELINREKEQNESLKTQIFILEQANKKKDHIIALQKKKIDSQKDDEYSFIEKEIYVLDPTQAILQINDELLLYKQIYENLSSHIKETKESMKRYEDMIIELQNENSKLRNQYKLHILSANRERETLISAINNERLSINNTRAVTENGSKSVSGMNKSKLLTQENQLVKKFLIEDPRKKFESEEFVEIIKMVGLTQAEFEKLSKNKQYSKLTEAIEMMFRLLKDKNITLNLLDKENENLTAKNYKLNKDNMILFRENVDLKTSLKKSHPTTKSTSHNSSLINNTSKINVAPNKNIEKTLATYKNLLKSQIEQNEHGNDINLNSNANTLKYNNSEANIENSENDSIVYTQNIKDEPEILDESNGKNKMDKKLQMTIESITSSEFREGCKGVDSFMSTVRNNNSTERDINGENEKKESNNNSNELEIHTIKTTNI